MDSRYKYDIVGEPLLVNTWSYLYITLTNLAENPWAICESFGWSGK